MTLAANDVARPAKRRRRKITDPEDYFLPPKLPAAKDVAMRIRGTDQAGRAYARRLAALGFIHCETPAWIEARDLFLGAVDAINVSSFGTGIREGALIAILGESHSGKTHILRRLSWHIQLQEDTREQGLYRPLVRVKVRAPTTMKGLGEDILTELRKRDTPPASDNAPVRVRDLKHRTSRDIWSELGALLRSFGVSVLIIDEVHNVLTRGAAEDYDATAAAIKSLVIDDNWPMTVVLAGTKAKMGRLIKKAKELQTRAECVVIEPIDKGHADEIKAFVVAIEKKLDLPESSGLGDEDRPERFWLASNGHRGRIAKLIYRAAEEAYKTARPRLDDALFADVLRRRYNVIDAVNPFLYAKLDSATPIPDEAWENKDDDDDDDETSLIGNGRGL